MCINGDMAGGAIAIEESTWIFFFKSTDELFILLNFL